MKIISTLLLSLSLFSASVGSINPASAVFAESIESEEIASIETTSPLDDLMLDQAFAEKYMAGGFRKGAGTECSVENIAEYKYDVRFNDDYNLYFYIFNPSAYNIDYTSYKNDVLMKFSESNTEYFSRFRISFVTKTADNLFLKFKILENEKLYNSVDKIKRLYNISTINLQFQEKNQIKSYEVGSIIEYSGYAKGINGNTESSLSCHKKGFDVLRIKANGGSVRSDMVEYHYVSGQGSDNKDYQKFIDLFYVYFSVPNSYINNFGELYSIEYDYYKYTTNKTIYEITSGIYNYDLSPWVHNNFWDGYECVQNGRRIYNPLNGCPYMEQKSITIDDIDKGWLNNPNVFIKNGFGASIEKEEIEQRINYYGISAFSSQNRNDVYRHENKTINDLSLNVEAMDFETKIWDWTKPWWTQLFNGGTDIAYHGNSWKDLEPIVKIESPAVDGSTYTINSDDVNTFNKYYETASRNNESTYLLRFDTGDYYVQDLKMNTNKHSSNSSTICTAPSKTVDIGYRCVEDIVLDFQIITLGFKIDEEITIIPVAMDPINIIPDTSAPENVEVVTQPWWIKIIAIVMVLLIIVGVIALIKSLTKEHRERINYKANKAVLKEQKTNTNRRE